MTGVQTCALPIYIKGKKVEFERSIRETHRKLKRGILRWIVTDRPQNILTAPVIYGMVVPMVMLDLCVTFYQWICFPVYRIARVKRGDYIVFDRNNLGYLNWFERLHCEYCAYGNGLIAYAAEIVARTEQYFCPIKHARKVLGSHARYRRFLDYGEAARDGEARRFVERSVDAVGVAKLRAASVVVLGGNLRDPATGRPYADASTRAGESGQTVQQWLAARAFAERLRLTAQAEEPAASALDQRWQLARQEAHRLWLRRKAAELLLDRALALEAAEQRRRERIELEDSLSRGRGVWTGTKGA